MVEVKNIVMKINIQFKLKSPPKEKQACYNIECMELMVPATTKNVEHKQ